QKPLKPPMQAALRSFTDITMGAVSFFFLCKIGYEPLFAKLFSIFGHAVFGWNGYFMLLPLANFFGGLIFFLMVAAGWVCDALDEMRLYGLPTSELS
ncbi:MAG: hypothetical protein AAF901_13435, partial [Bacteroidota bacterium]